MRVTGKCSTTLQCIHFIAISFWETASRDLVQQTVRSFNSIWHRRHYHHTVSRNLLNSRHVPSANTATSVDRKRCTNNCNYDMHFYGSGWHPTKMPPYFLCLCCFPKIHPLLLFNGLSLWKLTQESQQGVWTEVSLMDTLPMYIRVCFSLTKIFRLQKIFRLCCCNSRLSSKYAANPTGLQ